MKIQNGLLLLLLTLLNNTVGPTKDVKTNLDSAKTFDRQTASLKMGYYYFFLLMTVVVKIKNTPVRKSEPNRNGEKLLTPKYVAKQLARISWLN